MPATDEGRRIKGIFGVLAPYFAELRFQKGIV